jgi:hypothetical protein
MSRSQAESKRTRREVSSRWRTRQTQQNDTDHREKVVEAELELHVV